MFAEVKVKLLEPNAIYLEESPLKIFKFKKEPKKLQRVKKMAKKKNRTTRNRAKAQKSRKPTADMTIKNELASMATELGERITDDVAGEDPLHTTDVEIKMEVDQEAIAFNMPDNDVKYTDNDQYKDDPSVENSSDEYEPKHELESESEVELEEGNEDDDDESLDSDDKDYDDEPLIMLAKKNKGRPRKYSCKKKKKPRKSHHVCKHQCTLKFTPEQRESMCDFFWSLSVDNRVQYIRNHIKSRVIRMKRKKLIKRANNYNCYYLDDGNTECPNLTRVCCKYFEDTLCLSEYHVKNALEGYQPEIEIEVKPLLDQLNKVKSMEEPSAPTEIQQILNPETGNLEIIEPTKAKKTKKPSATATPKVKRPRRKPGDPKPEHNPKPIKCAERCIFKCHTKFTEEERKKICDVYWSLEYNRRKDFILARIETRDVLSEKTSVFRKTNRPPRSYQTRFFLGSGVNSENNRVCKHFFMNTLSITRMFITDAIDFADKSTGCYTGTFGKGKVVVANVLAPERKKLIIDHIASYPTWVPKSKGTKRYLHHTLTIKRMFNEYKEMCLAKQEPPASRGFYYKTFHKEFSLYFHRSPDPEKGRGFLSLNPTLSHYTGDEPGGMWLDPQGRALDLELHNPADSFMCFLPRPVYTRQVAPVDLAKSSTSTAAAEMPSFSFNQALSSDHSIDAGLTSSFICQTPVVRQELNPNEYPLNLPQSYIASTSLLFRRL